MKPFFTSFLVGALVVSAAAFAKPRGRFDIGPAYINLQVQEHGQIQKVLNMGGFRADTTFLLDDRYGWALKPYLQWVTGRGALFGTGIGFGHYFPIGEKLKVLPLVGYSYNRLRTHIDIPFYNLVDQKERFFSNAVYLGGDISYKLCEKWAVTCAYQYAFARTRTVIGDFLKSKGSSKGSTVSGIVDYYLNDKWGITLAVAYNNSLSKEKHGIEALGGRLGVVYFY